MIPGALRRILPPTKLERDLALQCVLSAFATGSFLTGTAVFFTQIVGLTGSQVGLGMSIAGVVTLLLSLPLGRLSDRVGAKPLWAVASLVEALLYFAWPLAGGMLTFVAAAVAARRDQPRPATPGATSTGSRSSRARSGCARWPTCGRRATSATPWARWPAASRWRSVPATAIMAVPVLTGGLLVLNAVMVSRLPHDRTTAATGCTTTRSPPPRPHRPGATSASSRSRSATAC